MNTTTTLYILTILALVGTGAARAQTGYKSYSAYKQIPVPGNGNWDYLSVDPVNRRLYLSHGEKVDIVDIDKDEVTGEIDNQHGVHGIAIAIPENKGFISNGKSSDVTVFDLRSGKIIQQVASTGQGVDAITYDPFMHYVMVHNSKSHSVTVIDARTNKIKGTVENLGKTEFGASDLKGFYYINLEAEGKIAKIDLRSLKKVAEFPLGPDHDPAGMALDAKDHRIFCGARSNNLVVLDTETGKIITTIPIGDHNDAVVFDPATRLIYVSSILADITIIQQDTRDSYRVVQHVKTRIFSKTMALDIKTKKLYLPSASFDGTDEKTSKILPGTFQALVFRN
jgi:WD40 repeat protein